MTLQNRVKSQTSRKSSPAQKLLLYTWCMLLPKNNHHWRRDTITSSWKRKSLWIQKQSLRLVLAERRAKQSAIKLSTQNSDLLVLKVASYLHTEVLLCYSAFLWLIISDNSGKWLILKHKFNRFLICPASNQPYLTPPRRFLSIWTTIPAVILRWPWPSLRPLSGLRASHT